MEKEVQRAHTHIGRSKLAIFAIVGFLAVITYLLITISNQLQTASITTGTEAASARHVSMPISEKANSGKNAMMEEGIGYEQGDSMVLEETVTDDDSCPAFLEPEHYKVSRPINPEEYGECHIVACPNNPDKTGRTLYGQYDKWECRDAAQAYCGCPVGGDLIGGPIPLNPEDPELASCVKSIQPRTGGSSGSSSYCSQGTRRYGTIVCNDNTWTSIDACMSSSEISAEAATFCGC